MHLGNFTFNSNPSPTNSHMQHVSSEHIMQMQKKLPMNRANPRRFINQPMTMNRANLRRFINQTIYTKQTEQRKQIVQAKQSEQRKQIVQAKQPKAFKSIIPLHIFQTWHTLDLPFYMKKNMELLKKQNPEFTHHLFDDAMCRSFIQDRFDKKVLHAFDKLKPGAYKADLWRYCVLYKYGGIYLDIKYKCCNQFKLYSLTDAEYFIKDRPVEKKPGIYQALMICLPKNKFLYNCINQIVENVKNNIYKNNTFLTISGPGLVAKYIPQNICKHVFNGDGIIDSRINTFIMKPYDNYRQEQSLTQGTDHYGVLWLSTNIYNHIFLDYISKTCVNEKNCDDYHYKNNRYINSANIKCLQDSYTTSLTCEINKERWLLCYKMQYNSIASQFKWQHYFIIYDSEMNLVKFSELFNFEPSGSEVCIDFFCKEETILFKYKTNKNKICIAKCRLNWIQDSLMWYSN